MESSTVIASTEGTPSLQSMYCNSVPVLLQCLDGNLVAVSAPGHLPYNSCKYDFRFLYILNHKPCVGNTLLFSLSCFCIKPYQLIIYPRPSTCKACGLPSRTAKGSQRPGGYGGRTQCPFYGQVFSAAGFKELCSRRCGDPKALGTYEGAHRNVGSLVAGLGYNIHVLCNDTPVAAKGTFLHNIGVLNSCHFPDNFSATGTCWGCFKHKNRFAGSLAGWEAVQGAWWAFFSKNLIARPLGHSP